MLFYTTVLIGCVIAAVVIPWVHRTISNVGSTIHKTIAPQSDKDPTSHLQTNPLAPATQSMPTHWDLQSHDARGMMIKNYNGHSKDQHQPSKVNSYFCPNGEYSLPLHVRVELTSAGWIKREDRLEKGGRTYKVTRLVRARELHPRYVDKPLSWQ